MSDASRPGGEKSKSKVVSPESCKPCRTPCRHLQKAEFVYPSQLPTKAQPACPHAEQALYRQQVVRIWTWL